MLSPDRRLALVAIVALVALLPACKKDQPPAPTPEPPAPAPAPPPAPTPRVTEAPEAGDWEEAEATEQTFLTASEINRQQLLKMVYFDYDRAEIRADQRATLQANAAWLRDNQDVTILIEGHCDERGTREYNLALGDRRAQAAREYLVSLGVPATRIETVSYGEERPVAQGEAEQYWSQNRRAAFVAVSTGASN